MVTKFYNVSTDPKLSTNSNILVPSEKAVRSFIASKSIQLDFLQSSTPTTYSAGQKWLNTSDNKLYTAVSSSNWGTGESVVTDQFFTFEDLLYYYNGTNISDYSTLTITEQNQERKLKTWLGTKSEYDALGGVYDSNTIYQVIEASADYPFLATQEDFNSSSSTTAATPYQVNQALGNYLSLLNGGIIAAGKTIGLTNSNNNTVTVGYNTSSELTINQGLNVTNNISGNTLIARSGNIYKVNTSGAKAIWNNDYATSSTVGVVSVDNSSIQVSNSGQISSKAPYITETYSSGYDYYRVWSDGWCEQGGRIDIASSSYADKPLLKPYNNTNYLLFFSHSDTGTGGQAESYIRHVDGSTVRIGNSCGNAQTFCWKCEGYITSAS